MVAIRGVRVLRIDLVCLDFGNWGRWWVFWSVWMQGVVVRISSVSDIRMWVFYFLFF